MSFSTVYLKQVPTAMTLFLAFMLSACSGDKETNPSSESIANIQAQQTQSSEALTSQAIPTQINQNASINPNSQKIINVCLLQWEPFGYLNSEKQVTGLLVELATETINNIGYQANVELVASVRCLTELVNQRFDLSLITSLLTFEKIGQQLFQIEHSVQYQLPVILLPKSHPGLEVDGFESLEGMNIGTISSSSYMRKLKGKLDIKWTTGKTSDSLWKLAASDRLDAVLGDYQSVVLFRSDINSVVKAILPPLDHEPLYWATHKSNSDLGKAINNELARLESIGRIDEIYRKHLGFSFTELRKMIDTNEFPSTTTPEG